MRVVVFGDPHWCWPHVVIEWLTRLPRCELVVTTDMPVQRIIRATAPDFGYIVDMSFFGGTQGRKAQAVNNAQAAIDSSDACISFWDGVCKPTKLNIMRARKTLPTWVIYSPPTARVIGAPYQKVNL